MPKRKAETSPTKGGGGGGGGGTDASTTPKKSKKEARAEAAARAKAWHDSRNGRGGGATAAVSVGTAAANAAALSTSSSTTSPTPTFSAGKATPSSKSGSATKRRRTPATTTSTTSTPSRNRNSTGGGTTTTTRSASPATSDRDESTTPAKKSRRSVGANASKFEFAAPATGAAPLAASSSTQSPFSSSCQTESKSSTSEIKRKRKDGLEAIKRLRMERESKGLPVKHSPENHLNSPNTSSATATAASESTTSARAVDPPPSAAMAASAAASAARATTTATTSATTEPYAQQPSPASRTASCTLPPSVASIFAKQSPILLPTSQKSTPDPPYQKFDPSQPFPTTGYKLRTAAYCGCGPTPNSNSTVTARRLTATAAPGASSASSFCQNITRTVPFTTPRVQYSNDGSVVGSEATSEGGDDEEELDERKLPYQQRPSPPGQYGGRVHPQQQQMPKAGETLPDAGLLANAILRARGILNSAAAGSQRRREGMGISGLNHEENNGVGVSGIRPNNSLLSEAQAQQHARGNGVAGLPVREPPKVAVNAALAGNGGICEKPPADPPMVQPSSSTIPYTSTLQKFRNVAGGGGASHWPESGTARTQQPHAATSTKTAVTSEPSSAVKSSIEPKPPVTTTNLDPSSSSTTSPSRWKNTCLSVGKLLLVSMGVLYLLANTSSNRHILSSTDHTSKTDDHVSCFINHPHTVDVYTDGDQVLHEAKQCVGEVKPCPQWGRCHEGKLLDCTDEGGTFGELHRFVPNVRGDQCIPSSEANGYIRVVNDVLLQMTSDLICQSGWNDDDTAFPLFSLDIVVEKVKEASDVEKLNAAMSSELLRWLSPAFDSSLVRFGSLSGDLQTEYLIDAIGLGQEVSPNSLPLPMRCRLNLMMWELLGYFFHSSLGIMWFLVKTLFRITTNYPLYSIGAFAFGQMIQYFRRRRKHRAKIRELHGIVLEAVYDRLSECEDHEGYAALILRDDIGHDMYPTNFAQRLFINDYVWRRVALEIHADNRVRKFRKLTNGKELEHWDFAVQSKRGRRLRKSIGGTPVGTLGSSGNDCGANSEDVPPPKRDP